MSNHPNHVTDGLSPPLRKGAGTVAAHQPSGYHVGMKNARHLFVLAPGVLDSTSPEEVEATKVGLEEVGLFHMPYERDVYIQLRATDAIGPDVNPDHNIVYGPFGKKQTVKISVHDAKRGRIAPEKVFDAPEAVIQLSSLLVILLATRNAEKTTTENKLARLGIGKSTKHRFAYTTTISLPRDLPEDGDNPPRGGSVAPHLRRGHVRRQHYGKENLLEKKIWIAPVFVNADPAFVATRTKYRIVT